QSPQENETPVAPMTLQQRRLQSPKDACHEPGVLLLFLDEQLDGRLVNRVTRRGRLAPQVAALSAFTDLEPLQRSDQGPAQFSLDLKSALPRDFHPAVAIVFEILQPAFHKFRP